MILSHSGQHSQENKSPPLSSCPIESKKLVVDETWLSNKQYNGRVAQSKEFHRSKLVKTSRTATYQIGTGQLVHERIYTGAKKSKIHLAIAVNGASKSMRGQLPLSNLNLTNGDFGDDAGMIMETRDYCFVGEQKNLEKIQFDIFSSSGLADGAGGNRSLGINPADFSRAILASCREILHQTNLKPNQLPRLILAAMQQVEANRIRGKSMNNQ